MCTSLATVNLTPLEIKSLISSYDYYRKLYFLYLVMSHFSLKQIVPFPHPFSCSPIYYRRKQKNVMTFVMAFFYENSTRLYFFRLFGFFESANLLVETHSLHALFFGHDHPYFQSQLLQPIDYQSLFFFTFTTHDIFLTFLTLSISRHL